MFRTRHLVKLRLSDPVGLNLSSPATAELTIIDNDGAGVRGSVPLKEVNSTSRGSCV
ncbi:MAG: hypothetical protein GY842_15365 [bacterium]|nr:hypothetical protein [bacterium]